MSKLRPRLTYSNVIASVALFVALGGAAVAAGLPRNSVGANQLKKGAVTAAKIHNGAVTAGKLAPKSVVAGKLGPNAVTPGNLGNGVVGSTKIAEGAVLAKNIKNGVVTTNKLQNESVTAAKLGKEVAPLLGTLKSGQTLRGVFDVGGGEKESALLARGAVSFQFPLSGNPPAVTVLKKGETTANCSWDGSGSAPAATGGNLCVYLLEEENLDAKEPLKVDYDTRLGFGLLAKGDKAASFAARGMWAVTAP